MYCRDSGSQGYSLPPLGPRSLCLTNRAQHPSGSSCRARATPQHTCCLQQYLNEPNRLPSGLTQPWAVASKEPGAGIF